MDSVVFARRLSIFLAMVIVGLSPIAFLIEGIVVGMAFFAVGFSVVILYFNQRKLLIFTLAFIILAVLTYSSPSRILFSMYDFFVFFLFRFYGFGQIFGYFVGIIAYCMIVSYLTSLLPSPAFRVPFLDGLLHLLAAISILSVYPSEGVIAPLHSKYAGGHMARELIPPTPDYHSHYGAYYIIFGGVFTLS